MIITEFKVQPVENGFIIIVWQQENPQSLSNIKTFVAPDLDTLRGVFDLCFPDSQHGQDSLPPQN